MEYFKDFNEICMVKGHRRVQDMLREESRGQIMKGASPIIRR